MNASTRDQMMAVWSRNVRDRAAVVLANQRTAMANIELAKALDIKPRSLAQLLLHDNRFKAEIYWVEHQSRSLRAWIMVS